MYKLITGFTGYIFRVSNLSPLTSRFWYSGQNSGACALWHKLVVWLPIFEIGKHPFFSFISKRNPKIPVWKQLVWNDYDLADVSLELKVCGRWLLNRPISLTLVICKDEAQLLMTGRKEKGLEILWGKILEGGAMREKLITKYMFYKGKLFL